ncbi:AbrB/MazE/SpoVT family DNA-binding domain-containing protein [Candidatus Woesearchaeota archaeon]|nr:AbrB/MazE/SpoVT family DNA-binding domain-containing protein [Candidatus Woesearchaeota archaeon]
MKVVLNRGQYKITIPKDLAEEKGWGAGTKIRFVEDADGKIFLKVIELKPLKKEIAAKDKTRK